MAIVSLTSVGSSVKAFAGGLNIGAGQGDTWTITLGNTTLTAGPLVVGTSYTIKTIVAGDDFTNVGAASNANGVVFVATGTTPTDYSHGSTLILTSKADNTLELNLLTPGQTRVLSAGDVIGTLPVVGFTLSSRVFFISGSALYFSALGDATEFESQGIGSGFVEISNQYAEPEPLTGLAPYQGKLAVMGRRNTLIYEIDADPANFRMVQVLPNLGTVAPQSVQPVGDMDVYMLADNGVRSLRVRDASNNASIADVGTPIDKLLQAVLNTLTTAEKAAACAVVEPSSNRYWCFVPNADDADNGVGKIYVFSYFPSSAIAAWSTYSPSWQKAVAAPAANYAGGVVTYSGLKVGTRYAWTPGAHETQILPTGGTALTGPGAFVAASQFAVVTGSGTTVTYTGTLTETVYFVPEKFVVYQGQVWARGRDQALYQHGGGDNNTYDNCGVSARTPYIDNGSPATRKSFGALDAGFQGNWIIGASADYITDTFKTIYQNTQSSFRLGRMGYGARGTHYALNLVEHGNDYALFSTAIMHIEGQGNEK